MINFLKRLYEEVDSSEVNFFGRLAIVTTFLILYTLGNQWFCSTEPKYSFVGVMLLGWFFYIMLAICVVFAGFFLVVIVAGILWIFSGEYEEETAVYIVTAPLNLIRLIILFVFGDWNRFFWRKNEAE